MFHPNEVSDDEKVMTPRPDLPSFEKGEDVALYLSNNPNVSNRSGMFVKLAWAECPGISCVICHPPRKLNGGW